MKNLVYFGLAAAGLAALLAPTRNAPVRAQAVQVPVAAPAAPASSVKGDLVIDFLGAVRGYVEPCG